MVDVCAHCRGVNIVILNWQRPLWEVDQGVLKRSGRDEPIWIAIHKCMEAMLGISLCHYLCHKLPKTLCLSYYLLCFLFNKIRYKRVEWGGGMLAHTIYIHMSKRKNDKIKIRFQEYTMR
jgi:hypothetical protein